MARPSSFSSGERSVGIDMLIQLGVYLLPLLFAFGVGTLVERAHFRRLEAAEAGQRDIIVSNLRRGDIGIAGAESLGLVVGDVVISTDYFKSFAANLKKLVGGELRTYESLLERARREAVVRMVAEAQSRGADRVTNVRFSTSSITGGPSAGRKRVAVMVEVVASGTAIRTPSPPTGIAPAPEPVRGEVV